MKTFQLTQKNFEMASITQHQSTRKYPFIVNFFTYFLVYLLAIISCAYYLCNKSDAFIEYIASFYLQTSLSVCFTCYVHIVAQMSDVFTFIQAIDDFLKGSE